MAPEPSSAPTLPPSLEQSVTDQQQRLPVALSLEKRLVNEVKEVFVHAAQNGVISQAVIATKLANSPRMTCMAEDDLRAVKRRIELADAKLGVAVNLGWVAAGFAAVAMYLLLGSWLAAIGAFVLIYVVAIYKYRKDDKVATDAYERATGTGKYRDD